MRRIYAVLIALSITHTAAAYHWFNDPGTGPAAGTFVFWHWNTLPVHYIVDNEALPAGLTFAGDIQPAFDAWQNVPTSRIAFQHDTNTTGITNFTWAHCAANAAATSPDWGIVGDGRNEVGYVHDADFGPNLYGRGIGTVNTDTGEIIDFVLLVNVDAGGGTDPTLRGVMTHEIGHTIGLGHSAVGSADFTAFPLPQVRRPTMYAWAETGDNDRLESLEPDDIAIVSRIYPETVNAPPSQVPFSLTQQMMSGKVLKGTDGTFARGVEVRLVNVADNNIQIASLSDFNGDGTGNWSIPGLPTGNWWVLIDEIAPGGAIPPNKIEGDGVGSLANTYASGFPEEGLDAAESNHDVATDRIQMPVFDNWDTGNAVLITNEGAAAPDLAITPWGVDQTPPAPPWYQTPDIWVDNNGNGIVNEPDEPERGRADNHLFARITNRGGSPISSYQVKVAFKPYTTNASAPAVTIATIPETTSLAGGSTRTYSTNWDLTSAFIAAHFDPMFAGADHFCVQVTIEGTGGGPVPGDVNPTNNFAQNNFANVPECATCFQTMTFYLYNHLDHAAIASLEYKVTHGKGRLVFEGIADPSHIALASKQWLAVTARLDGEGREAAAFDVTQRLDGQRVGGLTVALTPTTAAATAGRGWLLGTETGANWPIGTMRKSYEPSVFFAAQLERALSSSTRLGLQLGRHHFDAKNASALDDLGITNVSLIGRFLAPAGSASRGFLLAGPGAYSVAGSWKLGVQLGAGWEVPLGANAMLDTGLTVHLLNAKEVKPRWVDTYIGLLFRIP